MLTVREGTEKLLKIEHENSKNTDHIVLYTLSYPTVLDVHNDDPIMKNTIVVDTTV